MKNFNFKHLFVWMGIFLFYTSANAQVCVRANFGFFSQNNNVIQFVDSSFVASGYNSVGYSWSFGDGSTATNQSPIHTYSQPGIYTVCLKVSAFNSQTSSYCVDSICKQVNVQCAGLAVTIVRTNTTAVGLFTFKAIASGGVTPYFYNWSVDGNTAGNGTDSLGINLSPGVHQVCVNVFDGMQCSGYYCYTVTVAGCTLQNAFTYTLNPNGVAVLNATQTGGTGPYNYYWYVNGTPTNTSQPTYSVVLPTGVNQVCLYTYDANQCFDSTCQTITNTFSNCANFNFTISKLLDTTTQKFSAYANPTGGQSPYTYAWSNGAATQVIQNANPGVYCVTVSDVNGCVKSKCDTFRLPNTNCANFNFTISKLMDTATQKYSAYAQPTGGQSPYTYTWSIGATTQVIQNVNPGVYCVTVLDANGCSKSKCDTFVSNIPFCRANFQVTSTCDSVFITNTSTIGTGTYSSGYWRVGTNTYPLTSNPNGLKLPRSIIGGGVSVNIILEYSLNNGCTDTMRKTITLAPCYSDTICGVAFIDLNGNGVFDNTDSVLKFQTVCLYGNGFQQCAQTNANGQYYIAVPPGVYTVYTNVSGGLSPTIPVLSNNPNTLRGYDSVVISGGGRHCGYDFGFQDLRVTITGTVYFDLNNNGVQDPGENGVPNVLVKIGNYSVYTNSMGFYIRQVPVGTYAVSYTASGSYIGYTVNPTSYSVAATTVGSTYGGNNFGLYIVPGTCNAKVNLIAYSTVTPGFPAMYKVYVYNIGGSVITGTLDFFHDPLLVLNYTSPTQTSSTANSISWNVGAIAPGSYKYFYVKLDAPTTVQINQPFFALADFNPNCTDVDLSNNVDTTHQLATASWDPNNKLVSPTGEGEMGKLKSSQKLTYTINFQNTGTAPAVNVVLIDTLSTHLDWNSVEVKESSHSSNVTIENGILNAKYSQIMLPDSNTNEPESHGFLSFTVNMKPNLPQGTVVNNTGHIYFDYNEAVITNTTVNSIDYALSIADPIKENMTVTLYPNPFKSHTTIQIENANGRVFDLQIIDMTGRIIHTQKANSEGVFSIDRNSIASGIYTYVIFENGVKRTNGKLIAE